MTVGKIWVLTKTLELLKVFTKEKQLQYYTAQLSFDYEMLN